MRNKIIKGIFSVYMAICLSYGGVVALHTSTAASEEQVAVETVMVETETASEPFSALVEESESEEDRESESDEESEEDRESEGDKETEETYYQESEDDRETEEAYYQDDDGYDYEEQISTEPVPTLAEFLRSLYCGGCGRCCPLISPSCRRGASKARDAEQEYYAIYGYEN